jgi:hypothetical protein
LSAALKLSGFALILGAVFAVALVAGGTVDPDVSTATAENHEEESTMSTPTHTDSETGHAAETGGEDAAAGTEAVPGLAVADAGYRLELGQTDFEAGPDQEIALRITGSEGETVRDFDVEHERELHLIVVRRDFEAFQHLHPTQQADGSWTVRADFSRPGEYRVFADFATDGQSLTLGADVSVAGRYDPAPLPAPSSKADAGDGYEVTISRRQVVGGELTPVEFTVSRNGRGVGTLDPYLGADGHLVALREGDLAFLHTHPQGEPGGAGPIRFDVEYPSAGRYRLFLQFEHNGEVRTAAFTQEAVDAGH